MGLSTTRCKQNRCCQGACRPRTAAPTPWQPSHGPGMDHGRSAGETAGRRAGWGVSEGDLNPHALIRALAPQASASAIPPPAQVS